MLKFAPPSKTFALELEEVAEKAQDLATYVVRANLLPEAYPQEPLNLLCTTLAHLPAGSAAGAYVTLDYARRRLPFFRPAARAKGQQSGDDAILRGEELDKKLMPLFMAVGSAIEVYLSETGEEDIGESKDPAVTPTVEERKSLIELDKEAEHTQQGLTEIQEALDRRDPNLGVLQELRRSIVDTQNHLGVGRAEISLPEPKPKLLARVGSILLESGEALGEFCERFSYAAEPAAEEFGDWLKRKIKGSVKTIGSVGRGLSRFSARWKQWPKEGDPQDADTALPPYDADEARAMIIRGEVPPEHWRSEIIKLYLGGTSITDLSSLIGLTSLKQLDLRGTLITDLISLTGVVSLESLGLGGTSITDFSSLAKLTSLKRLDLREALITDLSSLSGLTSLEQLDLRGTSITDFSCLAKLTSLERLYLDETLITDLSSLAGLTSLESLDLGGTSVTDLSNLSDLISLERLYLDGTSIAGLGSLTELRSLKNLYLGGTPVTSIAPICNHESLKVLDVRNCKISDLHLLNDNVQVFK